MCNIWWPTFGNVERSLFVSLSLCTMSTLNQSWKTSYVVSVCTHLLGYQLGSRVSLQPPTAESSGLQKQRSTQSTAHSHSTIKCNLSVTIRKSSPWRWPSSAETCRSVLRLMIKLSLCICWWLVFLKRYVSQYSLFKHLLVSM
jgi:hypothetical protein